MPKIDKVRIDLSRLSTVVCGWPKDNHAIIQQHFNILGMRDVRMTNTFEEARHGIAQDKADVILCNVNGERSRVQSLMSGIRQQEIGKNPFLVMISIVQPMDKSALEETIDSGPDDLLRSPFRRDVFLDRVQGIGEKRKKFVATAGFIGPTRRTSARPGQRGSPEFDVPNPVQSIGTGVPRDKFWRQVVSAGVSLNRRKINSDVEMINSLIEEIMPIYKKRNINEDFHRKIEILQSSLNALHRRALRFRHADIANLCDITGNIITDIKERPEPPSLRYLTVMPKMMLGFQAALSTLGAETGTA